MCLCSEEYLCEYIEANPRTNVSMKLSQESSWRVWWENTVAHLICGGEDLWPHQPNYSHSNPIIFWRDIECQAWLVRVISTIRLLGPSVQARIPLPLCLFQDQCLECSHNLQEYIWRWHPSFVRATKYTHIIFLILSPLTVEVDLSGYISPCICSIRLFIFVCMAIGTILFSENALFSMKSN